MSSCWKWNFAGRCRVVSYWVFWHQGFSCRCTAYVVCPS